MNAQISTERQSWLTKVDCFQNGFFVSMTYVTPCRKCSDQLLIDPLLNNSCFFFRVSPTTAVFKDRFLCKSLSIFTTDSVLQYSRSTRLSAYLRSRCCPTSKDLFLFIFGKSYHAKLIKIKFCIRIRWNCMVVWFIKQNKNNSCWMF